MWISSFFLFFCVVENPVPLQPLADNEPSQNYFIFLFPLAGYLLMGPHMLTREPLNSGVRGASAALWGESRSSVRIAVSDLTFVLNHI